jgi:hypothetical protein
MVILGAIATALIVAAPASAAKPKLSVGDETIIEGGGAANVVV